MTRKVLGRGLSALIPTDDAPAVLPRREYFKVAIEEVHPTADQPRRHFDEAALLQLVESIRHDGLLQPLLHHIEANHAYVAARPLQWRADAMKPVGDIGALTPAAARTRSPRRPRHRT